MSRTKHHSDQNKMDRCLSFGNKYNANKCYLNDTGKNGKRRSDRERRNDSKKIIREELSMGNEKGLFGGDTDADDFTKTLDEHSIRLTVPEQKALKRALSRSVKIIA